MYIKSLVALAIFPVFTKGQSLKHVLATHESLNMLLNLLEELDLMTTFEATQNSTLLAMNNNAFEYLANWGMNLSSIDSQVARGIMKYHFLVGTHDSANVLLGKETQLVHSVLRPPVLTNVTDGAVVKLSAADGKRPFRVECGIQKVLPIIDADIYYDSGVLHTIGENLVLPHNLSESTNFGNLDKFWSLVQRAQMDESLESLRDTTILLPSNEAMDKDRCKLDSLSLEDLKLTIKNHVIPNHTLYHMAFGVGGEWFTALSGLKVRMSRDSMSRLFVNHAQVLKPDVLIYGGVAHVLNNVLLSQRGSILDAENAGPCRHVVFFRWYKYPWNSPIELIFGVGLLCVLGSFAIQRIIVWKTLNYKRGLGGCATKQSVDEQFHSTSSDVRYYSQS